MAAKSTVRRRKGKASEGEAKAKAKSKAEATAQDAPDESKKRRPPHKKDEISLIKFFGLFFLFVFVVLYMHFEHDAFGGNNQVKPSKKLAGSIRVRPAGDPELKKQPVLGFPGRVIKKRRRDKLIKAAQERKRRAAEAGQKGAN